MLNAPPDNRSSQSNPTAASATERNFAANLAALAHTQPRICEALTTIGPAGQPTYARDGSLTLFGLDGKWWRNCSVPVAAAEAMLASLDVNGRVACFLAPTLAAHLRVALAKLRPDQAIIGAGSDAADVTVMLASEDFSADIAARRLWFAIGEDWPSELRALLQERPGLAMPAQFVRLPVTHAETVEQMVAAAGRIFSEASASRSEAIAQLRARWQPKMGTPTRLCVIAPSHFRLWDDAGSVLAETLTGQAGQPGSAAEVIAFDSDDPAHSSGVALLRAAVDCHAVVAADMSRADLAGIIPADLPWVTWVTRPVPIPVAAFAGTRDALVLADEAWWRIAEGAGWARDRVAFGGWPRFEDDAQASPPSSLLAVVSDTRPVVMPEALTEFSSHAMLWGHIAAELSADPFAIGAGPAEYLQRRMKQAGVAAEGFDAAPFLERLILPAYEQAVARLLLRAGLPVRLYGAGWDAVEGFAPHAAGALTSRADLLRIRADVTAVVDCSAGSCQALHRLGRPVVPRATDPRRLVAAAKQALSQGLSAKPPAAPLALRDVLALVRR